MMHLSLRASTPDVLEETITLCQSVQGIVALAHGAHKSAECVHLGLSGETAVLINLSDRDLDRGVILCLDDSVGGAALAWDVTASYN